MSPVMVSVLNLWCAEGMRSVKLSEVQRLRFLNPVMESEVRKALETLASSHDTQKKAVSISFTGEGERDVRVGYVIENPIWKTSYRLVLAKDGKPFLQGWAIVENPTDEDWNDVGMVLVSGRPGSLPFNPINQISFRMAEFAGLREMHRRLQEEGVAEMAPVSHGNALSIYFPDPEGNRIELFVDTPWYVTQPLRVPMDMKLSDAEIWAWAEAEARKLPGFTKVEAWRADVARKMGVT